MAATGLKSIEWLTAAWLAQLGECLSPEREVTGSNPGRTNTIHIMGWVGTVSSQMDWERLPVGPLYVAHVRAYYWHVKMYCKRARLLSYHRRLFIHSFHSLTHSFIHSFIHIYVTRQTLQFVLRDQVSPFLVVYCPLFGRSDQRCFSATEIMMGGVKYHPTHKWYLGGTPLYGLYRDVPLVRAWFLTSLS